MENTPAVSNMTKIKSFLNSEAISKKFQELLGSKAPGFITSVLQVVNSNKSLANADVNSIYGAVAAAAVLDLPINNNLGFAYIVPYNEKQNDGSYKQVAQFQIGYKGIKQLALRSSEMVILNDSDVREGEILSHDRLSGQISFNWIQDDKERLAKPIVGYVSYFRLRNGFEHTHYMTVAELEAHGKKFSQTYKKGFGLWKDDFNGMCRKTVVKLNLSKNAPLAIETQLSKALIFDQAKINDADTMDVEYIDNEDEPTEVNKERERLIAMINDAETAEQLQTLAPHIAQHQLEAEFDLKMTQLAN